MRFFFVSDHHHHVGTLCQAPCQYFRLVDGAMLPSRAPKGDHQVREIHCQVTLDGLLNQQGTGIGKTFHNGELPEVLLNRTIQSTHGAELFLFARVGQSSAVKNESSSIACGIFRNSR